MTRDFCTVGSWAPGLGVSPNGVSLRDTHAALAKTSPFGHMNLTPEIRTHTRYGKK